MHAGLYTTLAKREEEIKTVLCDHNNLQSYFVSQNFLQKLTVESSEKSL